MDAELTLLFSTRIVVKASAIASKTAHKSVYVQINE